MEFYLIRHGQTDWNSQGRFQGHTDIGLNYHGLDEAARLAQRLSGEPIGAVYASDLSRARTTAAPLAERLGLELLTTPALRERHYGIFEGLTLAQIEREHPAERARFATRDPDYAIPGGESLRTFTRRVLEQFETLCRARVASTVCVVTHGGVLDVLYRHAQGMPIEAPRRWPMRNAALNQVRVSAGRMALVCWGDAAHLEDRTAGG